MEQGRLDQLALKFIEHVVRAHVPQVAPAWDKGLGALVEYGIGRYVPAEPVHSFQIGNMNVPVDLAASFLRAAKMLPDGVGGPHAGA